MNTTTRPKQARITGISHLALWVHDIGKSRGFYKDFLGFEEPFRLDNPDGSLALTFIKINDLQCLELFPERQAATDRLHQIAFIVEDGEAMRAHLAANGVAVPERVRKGRLGNSNFSVKDPDGHTVEFVQYEPDGWTLKDTGRHMGAARIATRMRHVGFTVRSLEKSLAFYRGLLGCTETWRGSSDGKQLSWVNLKLPDTDEYIELMLYNDALSLERMGVLNHISLEVPDVLKAAAELEARPGRKSYGRPIEQRTGINHKRQLNLFDPDGTRAELMEPDTIDGVPPVWFNGPASGQEG